MRRNKKAFRRCLRTSLRFGTVALAIVFTAVLILVYATPGATQQVPTDTVLGLGALAAMAIIATAVASLVLCAVEALTTSVFP